MRTDVLMRGRVIAAFGLIAALMFGIFSAVLCTTVAKACGRPLTVEDIQHGIMPSEDNLPCKNRRSSPSRDAAPSTDPSRSAVPSIDNTSKYLKESADEQMASGEDAFKDGNHMLAGIFFGTAANSYRKAGLLAQAAVAEQKEQHCKCLESVFLRIGEYFELGIDEHFKIGDAEKKRKQAEAKRSLQGCQSYTDALNAVKAANQQWDRD